MMMDIGNWVFEISHSSDMLQGIFFWYAIIASLIFLIFFIRNEYYLIRRNSKKCNFEVNENYNLLEFIGYNIYLIFMGIVAFLMGIALTGLLWYVICLLLFIMALIEAILKLIGIWILIPIVFVIVKMILYRISLRYKK